MNTPEDAIAGDDSGGAGAFTVFSAKYKITHLIVRAAFAHRSRNYRIDGPGARAVRAPIVVLAEARKHSRESQAIEPIPNGFRMSPHSPSTNSRAVSVAERITASR